MKGAVRKAGDVSQLLIKFFLKMGRKFLAKALSSQRKAKSFGLKTKT